MKITNTQVFGFEAAVRGMRNPLASWDKSDSYPVDCIGATTMDSTKSKNFSIGPNDMDLMKRLLKSGPEHAKFMRMIHVQCDVDMPRYWWSEADTYHFNTKNSTSTMHKLLNNDNPITLDMFAICEEDRELWKIIVNRLESLRKTYKSAQKNDELSNKKEILSRLLLRAKRLLPEGFLQMRTWDTNYAELRTMYHQRKNHRLKEEWQDVFCKWVELLPYAKELIIGE